MKTKPSSDRHEVDESCQLFGDEVVTLVPAIEAHGRAEEARGDADPRPLAGGRAGHREYSRVVRSVRTFLAARSLDIARTLPKMGRSGQGRS